MTPMQEDSMRMIIASGDLLLAIVNDVLDFSKLETGNVEINIQRSNLQDTLSSVLHSIEMKARSRGQSVRSSFDATLPEYVHTDSRRLQQVRKVVFYAILFLRCLDSHYFFQSKILFNLLGNAYVTSWMLHE